MLIELKPGVLIPFGRLIRSKLDIESSCACERKLISKHFWGCWVFCKFTWELVMLKILLPIKGACTWFTQCYPILACYLWSILIVRCNCLYIVSWNPLYHTFIRDYWFSWCFIPYATLEDMQIFMHLLFTWSIL